MSHKETFHRVGGRITVKVICDTCEDTIMSETTTAQYRTDIGSEYQDKGSIRIDRHKCDDCKRSGEDAYDDHVDPLGVYH